MDILTFILGLVTLYLGTYLAVFLAIAFIFIIVAVMIYRAIRIK